MTVTCARDGRSHAVAHAVLADSLASDTGQCTAVCGHIVLPASLAAPPGDTCVLCSDSSRPQRRATRRWLWPTQTRYSV
ncbi:hypothetical protein WIS52_15585 [Pseudonocardia nematodicida]|uniref:Uncharacterized protein n=1 Tax=Pseudonocardia nematodicida TaxID=1206997 RepID=A0ABV1KBP6_9PSEU